MGIVSRIIFKLHQLTFWVYEASQRLENQMERERINQWVAIKGDTTLRVNYPELHDNSIVFDLGGYQGDWAAAIFSKYCSNVFIVEPIKSYADAIRSRFEKNEKVKVFNLALGASNGEFDISINNESSSIIPERDFGGHKQRVKIQSFAEFIKERNIEHIDLLKINIEGAEYDLLDHLIDIDYLNKIKNLQVQFHDFVPQALQRKEAIIKALKSTHTKTYGVDWVWENWKLKQ